MQPIDNSQLFCTFVGEIVYFRVYETTFKIFFIAIGADFFL